MRFDRNRIREVTRCDATFRYGLAINGIPTCRKEKEFTAEGGNE